MVVEVAGRLTPFNAETPKSGEKTRFRAGSDYSIHLKKQSGAQEMHRLNMLLFVVDIETLVEAINTSAGINELLLTCKERMAF